MTQVTSVPSQRELEHADCVIDRLARDTQNNDDLSVCEDLTMSLASVRQSITILL